MFLKKKAIIAAGLAMLLCLSFTACKSKDGSSSADANAYEKINEQLLGLKAFEAEATVKYISNKNENEYLTKQYGKITGEYRVEVTGPEDVAGNVTLSDGTTICQFNPNISGKIAVGSKESAERSEIFITSFIKNYLSSKEVSLEVSNFAEGRATVFEATVPGDHPYLATEKLWVDNETYLPLQLIIYDADGAERIVITYKSFKYNPELDANLFSAPAL